MTLEIHADTYAHQHVVGAAAKRNPDIAPEKDLVVHVRLEAARDKRPEDLKASSAAITASSMSRAITFVALR